MQVSENAGRTVCVWRLQRDYGKNPQAGFKLVEFYQLKSQVSEVRFLIHFLDFCGC